METKDYLDIIKFLKGQGLEYEASIIEDLSKENTTLKQRIEELKTSFENTRQNLHTKNKLLTNDKVEALNQQLDISVEALMQTKIISFWAVGYYNKDDATSDVLEKFERIGTVAKTALDKVKGK